jgi:glycosyltransferase involved in cell wall biosynthesis
MKSKICMLSIDHSPLDDRIYYKEACSLHKHGFEVTMLFCADENGFAYDMGGKKIINQDKNTVLQLDGIVCHLVKRDLRNPIEKILHKFFLGNFIHNFIQKGIEINADVYHAHEPVSYYLGLKIQEKTGAKLIFDSHESWVGGTLKDQFVKHLYLNKLTYLITANQITRGSLLVKNPSLKTEVIYNFAHPEIFKSTFEESKLLNPIIVHDGYLPFNRGLKEMIEVIKLLKNDFPKIKFRILGETKGEEKIYLQQKIEEYQLYDNIEETGWIDYVNVGNYLNDCSIGLLLKTNTPNNILGGPAIKLFHYFAYGIAVVDIDLPESTRFLNKTQSGISIQKRSITKITEAIELLLKDHTLLKKYCQNSFNSYQKFNWLEEEKKLVSFYKNEVLNDNFLYIR